MCAPPGLAGGRPGERGELFLNGERLTRFPPFRFRPGDELELRLPGGGGFGPPTDRMEADVGADVRAGYLTARAASRDYGLPIAELPS